MTRRVQNCSHAGTQSRMMRLGDVCKIEFGTRIRSKDSKSEDYPVYGGGGKTFGWGTYNRTDQCVVSRFAMSPECVRYVKGKFFLNDSGLTVRVIDTNFNQRFIDSFLIASQGKIYSLGRGCAQKNLKVEEFKNIRVPVLPLPVQKRVADEFALISELNRNIEERLSLLDQIVRSKFVELFGDPVLNDKGWPTSGLLEIGECKNGMNFSPKDSGYSLRCVGVGDFKDKVTLDDLERIATINVNARPKDDLILKDGDILFVRSNGNKALVGRSLLVHPGSNEVTFSGFCIRYRISSKAFLPEFAIYYLKHDAVRKALRGRGANIQNLSQKTIQTIQAILPPLPLQRKFAKFVAEVEKLKANLRETAATLDQIYRAKQQEYFG